MNKKGLALTLGLLAIGIAPFFGASELNLEQVFDFSSADSRILLQLRLPRCLLALSIGGGLAILGGCYQILFRNSLAEPYVLGISSVVIFGILLGSTFFSIAIDSLPANFLAVVFAILLSLTLCLVTLRSRAKYGNIILFGLGLNFLFSSGIFLMVSYQNQSMGGGSLRWLFGQIPWPSWSQSLIVASTSVVFLSTLLFWYQRLDAISLGDLVSKTLGYDANRTRIAIILVSSLYLGVNVPLTGAIGFIGLVVPHSVRLFLSPSSTRTFFLQTFLAGGVFLLVSDVISRTVLPPFEFPIGILTTLLGAPIFLFLLWRQV